MERRQRWGGVLVGLVLALGATTVHAQHWPGYGDYGYGTGFDYNRNPYSYPRAALATSASVPEETLALYGGYMPNAYYNGAAYLVSRAVPFPSGQAYCQSAGSYLYCADVESGGAALLSLRDEATVQPRVGQWSDLRGSDAAFAGLLTTSVVDGTARLQGVLASPARGAVALECNGPVQGDVAALSCRTAPAPATPR
jgi:hypothetical protein